MPGLISNNWGSTLKKEQLVSLRVAKGDQRYLPDDNHDFPRNPFGCVPRTLQWNDPQKVRVNEFIVILFKNEYHMMVVYQMNIPQYTTFIFNHNKLLIDIIYKL